MLLAPAPPAELPAEALLARLRAKRAGLDLHGVAADGPTPAAAMSWLYPRLERPLRAAILPYLEIEAMKCLLLALRYRLGGETVPPGLLHQPWLASELATLLEKPGEATVVVTRLEPWLADDYRFASGLLSGYLKGGPGQVEQQLAAGMLGHALARARAPVVLMAVRFLADVRNLLAILRYWRWRVQTAPPLLAGGELDAHVLACVWAAGDTATLQRLVARLVGVERLDLEPRAAERELLNGLTRRLRRAGRDPLGIGVVIDYLWRCQIAARNHALQQAAGGDDDLLAAALL